MSKGVDIPWVGVDIPWVWRRYTMGMEIDIPWAEGSILHV